MHEIHHAGLAIMVVDMVWFRSIDFGDGFFAIFLRFFRAVYLMAIAAALLLTQLVPWLSDMSK